MRTKSLLLSGFALLVLAGWVAERQAAARLTREIAGYHHDRAELARLTNEKASLVAQQPPATELAELRQRARDRAETAAAIATPLETGVWTPAQKWQNRGNAAPLATVETALWAAAGGDTAAFESLFVLDPATRRGAQKLLDRLASQHPVAYATPEDLIAAFAIKNIPPGAAQIAVLRQLGGTYDVTLFLRTGGMEEGTVEVYHLSLWPKDGRWFLRVPPSAVDKIAADLGLDPATAAPVPGSTSLATAKKPAVPATPP